MVPIGLNVHIRQAKDEYILGNIGAPIKEDLEFQKMEHREQHRHVMAYQLYES